MSGESSPQSKFVSARVNQSGTLDRKPTINIGRVASQSDILPSSGSEIKTTQEKITRAGIIEKRIEESFQTKEITLDRMALKSIPIELFNCTNLAKLYLQDNLLVVLPPEMKQLAKLKDLCLENNRLSSLPKEIEHLTELERLHCYNNSIITLPAEIGRLTNITRLFLGRNKIALIPPEIGNLVNLQWLALDHNNLSFLPPEISQLQNLGWLSLESNQISSLPDSIEGLWSLEFLSLVDNPVSALPETITKLKKLKDVRTDQKFKIPENILATRSGRTILQFLTDMIARWDLDIEERDHWVPNEYSVKCCRCKIPFTFTKRRHHCRLCGLLFCNKDCDQVCDVPGMQTPGRVCTDCYDVIDPSHPSNIYIQHCVEKAQKEANKFYGLAAGEEHLPLEERKEKIMEQINEVTNLITQAHNAQDGLKRLVDLYRTDIKQQNATIIEIEEGEAKIQAWLETKQELTDILRGMDEETTP